MRHLAILFVALAGIVADAHAKPNAHPPSIAPGKTNCASVNCKRRRVWRSRYAALPAADKAWLRGTRNCESRDYGLYRANTGNGYYGAYQFSWKTALAAGFTMYPNRTWRYEQDVRAIRWRNAHGAGQWSCG